MSLFKHSPSSAIPESLLSRWRVSALLFMLIILLLASVIVIGARNAPVLHRQNEQAGTSLRQMRPTNVSVLTYKNDTWRTGQNAQESLLTIHTVNARSFGKRASYSVDGRVYAQPLFVPHLRMHGALYNVVFVVTEHDSVYAFDADQVNDSRPLWKTSFISPPDVVPVSGNDIYCADIGGPDVGITGTPVIDLKTKTLYVVAVTKEHQWCLGQTNMDLGSAGPLLLPDAPEVIAIGKEGRIYVLDRHRLGGYHTIARACSHLSRTDIDQVRQEFPPGTAVGGVFGSPAYWHGPSGDYIYVSGALSNQLEAFQLTNGLLTPTPSFQSPLVMGPQGRPLHVAGNPVISCNGQRPGTAIVWLIDYHGLLRAYDAANLAHELYTSMQNARRDTLGQAIKFSVPTVANGEVFIGTTNSLVIYGLLGS